MDAVSKCLWGMVVGVPSIFHGCSLWASIAEGMVNRRDLTVKWKNGFGVEDCRVTVVELDWERLA